MIVTTPQQQACSTAMSSSKTKLHSCNMSMLTETSTHSALHRSLGSAPDEYARHIRCQPFIFLNFSAKHLFMQARKYNTKCCWKSQRTLSSPSLLIFPSFIDYLKVSNARQSDRLIPYLFYKQPTMQIYKKKNSPE
jgi:hypothetical protein